MRAERFDRDGAAPGGITPVILCGGSGTRLWPLSRADRPKQFTRVAGTQTLFEQTLARLGGAGFSGPVIVAGSEHRGLLADQCRAVAAEPQMVFLEPEGRNTAAAALAAALWLGRSDPAGLLLISPSDHVVADGARLRAAILRGAGAARAGQIVTFGAEPLHAETGYGWLEPVAGAGDGPHPLSRFVEKPDADTARRLFCAGTHLWNMGLFLCRCDTLIAAYRRHAPDLIGPVQAALAAARFDGAALSLDQGTWQLTTARSIDVAVMEKAGNLAVVPFDGHWTDLGDWNAVAAESARSHCAAPRTTAIGCSGSYLRSDEDGVEIVGIGLTDIVAVATGDTVLVAHRSQAQSVRAAADALRGRPAPQGKATERRPWGAFTVIGEGPGYKVKRLSVDPGARLSLQSHRQRAEHWVVVAGRARVSVDGTVRDLLAGDSVIVPVGAVHRLENPGPEAAVLIEVQTGPYLGEDDIDRHADDYDRCPAAAREPANVTI